MNDLLSCAWPEAELARAFERLAELSNLPCPAFELPPGSADLGAEVLLARSAEAAGLILSFHTVGTAEETPPPNRPAILRVVTGDRCIWLLSLPTTGRRLCLEDPRGRRHHLALSAATREPDFANDAAAIATLGAVTSRLGTEARRCARRLLNPSGLPPSRIDRRIELDLPPDAPWHHLARRHDFPTRALALLAVEFASMALYLGLWAWIGRHVLEGGTLAGAVVGWALGWLLLAPARWFAGRIAGAIVLDVSEALQRRLLAGALRLDLGASARAGTATYFAQAFEAERFESLLLEAGLQAVAIAVELFALGAVVLWARPSSTLALWLGVGFAVTAILARSAHRSRNGWTRERLASVAAGTEQILGHRTRLAQGAEAADREAEARLLGRLYRSGARLDGATVALEVWATRFWTIGAVLIVALGSAGETDTFRVASSLAVVLLADRTLTLWGSTLQTLSATVIAYRALHPLISPAPCRGELPELAIPEAPLPMPPSEVVLEARGLELHPPGRRRPTLAGVDIEIAAGSRVLLEGASGQGKSTLLRLLAGLRRADRGSLRLRGLDRSAYGDRLWRRRIALVPQFQENRLYSGPLAFNLLLGRQWPPAPGDLEAAAEICAELGLADLVARMPLGWMQPVGEGGWQLSHGERARVFLGRALLQPSDLLLLDESLAGLDPATARLALAAAERRSRALLVVAHT